MSRYVSAPEAACFNSSPEPIDTTPDAIESYRHAAEQLGIPQERALEFPELCTALTRSHEHLIRAQYGLFPYDHAHTTAELATLHKASERDIKERLYRARRNLQLSLQDPNHTTRRREGTAAYTLEEIARLLAEHKDILTDEQVHVLCALNGLPPHLPPLTTGQLAALQNVPRKKINRTEQAALALLTNPEDKRRQEPCSQVNQQIANVHNMRRAKALQPVDHTEVTTLAKRMELGWYAAGIVLLATATDHESVEQQLLSEAETAARVRALAAMRLAISKRVPLTTNFTTPAPEEQRKPIIQKYSTLTECDTPEGREVMLEMVRARAASVANDPEALATLYEIIKDGEIAEELLIRRNLRLIFHTASRLHGQEARAEEYGYEGLLRAVHGFDHSLGYNFSTYAVNWIAFYMREGLRKQRGLPKRRADEIAKMRTAELGLAQSNPTITITPAHIAAACNLTEARVKENYQLFRRSGTIPFSYLAAGHNNLSESSLPFEAALEAPSLLSEDLIRNRELYDAFETIFKEAQLTPRQLHAIKAHYGFMPTHREYDTQEIAAQLRCTPESVKTLISLAFDRIRRRLYLATHFAKYVKQP